MKRRATVAAVAVVLLATAGCGDGDRGRAAGNVGRYCDRLAAVERSDSRPTPGDLDELIRVAPPEIKDEVRSVVESGGTPFDDTPEARALLDRSRRLCG